MCALSASARVIQLIGVSMLGALSARSSSRARPDRLPKPASRGDADSGCLHLHDGIRTLDVLPDFGDLVAPTLDTHALAMMISHPNVSKHVSIRHANGPRRILRGPFALVAGTGGGDRIRTCDLWVMS